MKKYEKNAPLKLTQFKIQASSSLALLNFVVKDLEPLRNEDMKEK